MIATGGGNFVILATDRRRLPSVIKVLSKPVGKPKNPDHPNVFIVKRGRAEFEYRRVTLSARRFGVFSSRRAAESLVRKIGSQSPRWALYVMPWGESR